ncbi:hypothetical protein TRIUR3_14421 [Triticum urartu]|uniref:Uncharacterized protein n=1 Tax=Triticum urartu TaxID=4572 RepID=M8AG94_TRIUA|nr:hypothetical protein TRIUR3_14421 [Triticum urartu]
MATMKQLEGFWSVGVGSSQRGAQRMKDPNIPYSISMHGESDGSRRPDFELRKTSTSQEFNEPQHSNIERKGTRRCNPKRLINRGEEKLSSYKKIRKGLQLDGLVEVLRGAVPSERTPP